MATMTKAGLVSDSCYKLCSSRRLFSGHSIGLLVFWQLSDKACLSATVTPHCACNWMCSAGRPDYALWRMQQVLLPVH